MNEHLIAKLKARRADERGDVEIYKALAEEAAEQGCHKLSYYLKEIAHEEKTHADFIDEYLSTYDTPKNQEKEKK